MASADGPASFFCAPFFLPFLAIGSVLKPSFETAVGSQAGLTAFFFTPCKLLSRLPVSTCIGDWGPRVAQSKAGGQQGALPACVHQPPPGDPCITSQLLRFKRNY